MWRLLVLSLALLPFVVHCQPIVDTPVIDPPNPVAGQTVSVELHGGACVLYLDDPAGQPSTVKRDGSTIVLTVQAIVGPSGFCVYPIGAIYPFPIGAYGPGNYTVEVDAQYQLFLGDYVTQTLGVLSFTVSNAESVPMLSTLSLVLMGLILLAAAMAKRA